MSSVEPGDAVLTDHGALFVLATRDGDDGREVAFEVDGVLVWMTAEMVDPL